MNITKDLQPLAKPIDSLTPDPNNANDEGDIPGIMRSLEALGQLKPIVVDADGVVRAGNHTFLAAVELGWTEVAATSAEHLTDEQLTAFAIADNAIGRKSKFNDDMLAAQLADLREYEDLLAATAIEDDEFERLMATLDGDLPTVEGDSVGTANDGLSAGDRKSLYEQSAVRSVVIAVSAEQYADLIAQMSVLRERLSLDSNAELILHLVGDAL